MRNIKSREGKRKPGRRPDTRAEGRASGENHWLYGIHAVAAAVDNPDRRPRRLVVSESGLDALRQHLGVDWTTDAFGIEEKPRQELEALLPPGAVHQGVALLVRRLPNAALDKIVEGEGRSLILVLDQVTDPQNVGAILRSAEAFGAAALVMQDRHAPPESAAMAKAASGALERVPVARVANIAHALDQMKAHGYWSVGLAAEADTVLSDVDMGPRIALVLGAEGSGLRRLTAERCDVLARLPMQGAVGSLNVSNAAAVALYEFFRRP